jgi:hypothetical protein
MADKSEDMFGAASPSKSWTGEPQEHTLMSPPMDSTGVYWKPVFNILEGGYEILIVNAQHIKQE